MTFSENVLTSRHCFFHPNIHLNCLFQSESERVEKLNKLFSWRTDSLTAHHFGVKGFCQWEEKSVKWSVKSNGIMQWNMHVYILIVRIWTKINNNEILLRAVFLTHSLWDRQIWACLFARVPHHSCLMTASKIALCITANHKRNKQMFRWVIGVKDLLCAVHNTLADRNNRVQIQSDSFIKFHTVSFIHFNVKLEQTSLFQRHFSLALCVRAGFLISLLLSHLAYMLCIHFKIHLNYNIM